MRACCESSFLNERSPVIASLTLLAVLLLLADVLKAQPTSPTPSDNVRRIKVLSYNIRYGTANDGANHWNHRRAEVANLIRQFDPDLFGAQESLALQTDFLRDQLPAYEVIGVGRDDGKLQGEMVPIFFRRDRFEKIDSGNFWLSETPDRVASKSWDSAITRMATWVWLKDRQDEKGRELLFLNTHFDHLGQTARIESSKLLRARLKEISMDNLIIIGDFNATEASKPYQVLLDKSEPELSLIDTYRRAHPNRMSEEGTFSNFLGSHRTGPRIDWILASSSWKVESASIDRTENEGRTPSDHFAVLASLLWAE